MPDEIKEPPRFRDYAKRAGKILEETWLGKKLAKVTANLSDKEELVKWSSDVDRSERLEAFLRSPFWLKDLEPAMRAMTSFRPWNPAQPATMEQATVEFLRTSGRVDFYAELLSDFREWRRQGEEGRRRLRMEAERNQDIEKIRQGQYGPVRHSPPVIRGPKP